MELMYITNRTDIASLAQDAGVDRIFVDMEYIGKKLRQGGLDTVQSHHTIEDIKALRPVLTKSKLLVRCNPIHGATKDYLSSAREIDEIVTKHKSINNSKELIEDESINEIYLKLSNEWKRLCVRCNAECKLGMIATSGINNIVYMFEDNFVVYNKMNIT